MSNIERLLKPATYTIESRDGEWSASSSRFPMAYSTMHPGPSKALEAVLAFEAQLMVKVFQEHFTAALNLNELT